jgi:TetR/AcrR family transcriptional regulator, mexJK operon transcriptional repressor
LATRSTEIPGDNPPRRRPGRPTLSNEELLDKALDLFLEQGFERTSIDAITAAAGMAKRTVYARYGDKTTLFKAALKRAIDEWIVPVERLREAETSDLEGSLLAIGKILVANIMSPAGLRLYRLTNSESGRMPEIGAYNLKLGTEPTLAYLTDLFNRQLGRSGGAFPDAEDAAMAFLNLVVGGPANAAAWGVSLKPAEVDHQLRYSLKLFLHGIVPQRKAASESDPAASIDAEKRQLDKVLNDTIGRLSELRDRLGE